MQVTLNSDLLHVKKKASILALAYAALHLSSYRMRGLVLFLKRQGLRSILTFGKEPDIIHHFQLLKIRDFDLR